MGDENILEKICYCKNNEIFLDYPYFKKLTYTLNKTMLDIVVTHFIKTIDLALSHSPLFITHLNIKSLSLTDVEKYYLFIKQSSESMKAKYPEKLDKCIIYNSSSIFKQIFTILTCFMEKRTQEKFQLHNNL
jgi:hypothetical protein